MTLRLNGATSGYTEIDAPAVAGSNTLKLPGGNGTADQALVTDGSGVLSFADRGRMVLGTSQASTSGTNIDFTGIPSWVKKITVMFDGVCLSGTSDILVQLGDSGGIENTDYVSTSLRISNAPSVASSSSTVGGIIRLGTAGAVVSGNYVISNINGNSWLASGLFLRDDIFTTSMVQAAMSKSLSDTLTQLRVTTENGTDTFDAGSINILYEG